MVSSPPPPTSLRTGHRPLSRNGPHNRHRQRSHLFPHCLELDQGALPFTSLSLHLLQKDAPCWLSLRPGSMRVLATKFTSLAPILDRPSSSSWTRTRFPKSTEAHSHSCLRMSPSSMTLRAIFLALPRFHLGQLSSWAATLSALSTSPSHQIRRTGP